MASFSSNHSLDLYLPKPLGPFKYDALKEVCGDRTRFDSPLQKWGLKQIIDVDGSRALTPLSLIWSAAFGCRYMALYRVYINIPAIKIVCMMLLRNTLKFCGVSNTFSLFIFKVSWQCFFLTQLKIKKYNGLSWSPTFYNCGSYLFNYVCSCEWVNNPERLALLAQIWFLEDWYQPNDLSLLSIVKLCKNIFLWKRNVVWIVLFPWLLITRQDSWLQESGFSKRAVKHSCITRQLILWYIRSKKNHNCVGTSPCTFKRARVLCASGSQMRKTLGKGIAIALQGAHKSVNNIV